MGVNVKGPAYDVVVGGGGHNGLVCAVYLARAGWRTLVVEQGDRLGGAVCSAELTSPGFVHDVFSTNQGAFLGGPVFAELGDDLRRLGLRYAASSRPFASVFPSGRSLRVYQGLERTLESLRAHDPRDADGFEELGALFARIGPALFELYGTDPGSPEVLRLVWSLLRRLRGAGSRELAQLLVTSTRELGDLYLASPEAKALLAIWALHLDMGPDIAGGAVLPLLEVFGDIEHGMPIVEGGASRMVDALAALLREHGGEARTGAEVSRVLVDGGVAVGVELSSGERIAARRAVVASVTPTALYGRLLESAPGAAREAAARYRYGPGTMMIHLALSAPVPWAAGEELAGFLYVHVGPYVEDLAETYASSLAGLVPRSPGLVVGQPTSVDRSRAPEGGHVLWIQVRTLPSEIRGDATGEIEARSWQEAAEPVAQRVLDKLEQYAPGLSKLVVGRAVLTPADLERWNPNLVGGDQVAGSHHLRQNFVFRPIPGPSPYVTPVPRLFMTGASTWPGAGVTGLPGYLAARRVLDPRPLRRRVLRAAAVAGAAGVVAGALAGRRS